MTGLGAVDILSAVSREAGLRKPARKAMGGWGERLRTAGKFVRIARRDPLGVGGAWPVSDRTTRRLVRLAGVARGEIVMDAGAGHGNVTQALLELDPGPDRIYSIERSPDMFRLFCERLRPDSNPRLIGIQADLRDVAGRLDGNVGRIDIIISTIPVSRASKMDDIFAVFARILKPGGRLIQVSSDPFHCPKHMRRAGFVLLERKLDWYGLFPFFLFKAALKG